MLKSTHPHSGSLRPKLFSAFTAMGLAIGLGFLLIAGADAAPPADPPGQGGGGGGGSGGGGRPDIPPGQGGHNPGGGGGGKGDVYSDLVIAYRDVRGLPILAEFDTAEGKTYCVQPVSKVAISDQLPVANPVDGEDVWLIPLMGEPGAPPSPEGEEVSATRSLHI